MVILGIGDLRRYRDGVHVVADDSIATRANLDDQQREGLSHAECLVARFNRQASCALTQRRLSDRRLGRRGFPPLDIAATHGILTETPSHNDPSRGSQPGTRNASVVHRHPSAATIPSPFLREFESRRDGSEGVQSQFRTRPCPQAVPVRTAEGLCLRRDAAICVTIQPATTTTIAGRWQLGFAWFARVSSQHTEGVIPRWQG